ncbi:MAG: LPXTG cell wall anchor domain-containing protein [Oscillospiraceae bacterium]|nr:LPXTG cell wall anchor domain-containing protein [Oscillospiraceae bacterium]
MKNGKVVSLYTNIQNKLGKIGIHDMVDYYKVDGIANIGNLEWHIFQIQSADAPETGTIEWLAMEHGQYSVAIPYFPSLTTDMYDGYKFGGEEATTTDTAPADPYGTYTFSSYWGSGYVVLPEGWENGYYWTVDALSNYALSDQCSAEDNALIHSELAKMQQLCYDKAAEMKATLAEMSGEEAKAYATGQSAALAQQAHTLTLELYKHVVSHEHTYGEWETTTAPTCKDEGVATQTCKFCDATQTKSLPKSDGHSWDDGVVTKTATTEADGVKTYTCTVCQATKTEAIPALASDAGRNAPASEPNPATGDSANLMLLGAVMLLSVTGIVFVVKKKILVK